MNANVSLSKPMDTYVGQKRRQWSLHRNLLSHHSSWFQTHIKHEIRLRGGRIDLLDDDPEAFDLLVKWLYRGEIDSVRDMPANKKWDYAFTCQQLYLLAEKVDLVELKDLAMDEFRRGCFEAGLVPGVEEMMPIYKHTAPSSPFRRLVSDIAARQLMDPYANRDAAHYRACFAANADFAVDVINAIAAGTGKLLLHDPTEASGCQYHDHAPERPCPALVR